MIATKILEATQIPCEVYDNTTRLTIKGRKEAYIENYKGLLEYTCERIAVQMNRGRVLFCGENLCVEYYAYDCMKIVGRIDVIQYE